MSIMDELFAGALAFFYSIVPNYGFTIVALTLTVMIVLTPLTLKGTRSMMVMQQMQPEIKKLQSKYKDDRQKLNEELLKFYKENNISPLGGCLPLIVQMPVFIFLYQALRGLTQRVPTVGTNVGWVTGQSAVGVPLTNPPNIITNFDPAYLNKDTALYSSLSQTTTMNFFGMDLAESASQALSSSILHAIPYLLLIVVVGITGYVQQKQIQGRNPTADVNPQQQMMMKIMPVFLPVISFGLPAGLVLYFAVSNLYRIGQQAFISRSIYGLKRGESYADKLASEGKTPVAAGTQRGTKATAESTKSSRSGASRAPKEAQEATAGRSGKASKADSTPPATKGSATKASATKESAAKGSTAKDSPPKGPAAKGSTPRGSGSRGSGSGGRTTEAKDATTGKKPSGTDQGSRATGAGESSSPALQPRARRNKKR